MVFLSSAVHAESDRSNQLPPAKTLVLAGDADPVSVAVQAIAQRSLRQQRGIVGPAQMSGNDMLQPAAIKTCQEFCRSGIFQMSETAADALFEA